MPKLHPLVGLLLTTFDLLLDSRRLIGASLQPPCRLAAENLLLRKQLALYLERQVKPHRAKAATCLTLVLLSKLFAWREVLTVVKPKPSPGGIAKAFGCLGGGNRSPEDGRGFLPSYRN
jgi:hypothetical protein